MPRLFLSEGFDHDPRHPGSDTCTRTYRQCPRAGYSHKFNSIQYSNTAVHGNHFVQAMRASCLRKCCGKTTLLQWVERRAAKKLQQALSFLLLLRLFPPDKRRCFSSAPQFLIRERLRAGLRPETLSLTTNSRIKQPRRGIQTLFV